MSQHIHSANMEPQTLPKKRRPEKAKGTGRTQHFQFGEAVQRLTLDDSEATRNLVEAVINHAMVLERDQFIGAEPYQRTESRKAYANGYKPKRVQSMQGPLNLKVPKTAGHEGEPFYPTALERGMRSTRAMNIIAAEMYFKGISTRGVEKLFRKCGIKGMSPSQVSRAAKMLDEEFENWRKGPLGECWAIYLDARYEKVRINGVVRDAAVLTAIGSMPDGRRTVLGLSVALSEAAVHWKEFLQSMVDRGLRGVRIIVSDDHGGLKAARREVFGGAPWQRCQFHLAQNAVQHAPTAEDRKTVGGLLKSVWNAPNLEAAETALENVQKMYRGKADRLADWLGENVPEGLTVFEWPESIRRRLRTSNPIERCIQQELKRRTRTVRVFPNKASLLRLASAILMEIDEQWRL